MFWSKSVKSIALYDGAFEIESGNERLCGQGSSLLNKAGILVRIGRYQQAESLLNEILEMPDPRTKLSAVLNLSDIKSAAGHIPKQGSILPELWSGQSAQMIKPQNLTFC